jgi:hypothetical protein
MRAIEAKRLAEIADEPLPGDLYLLGSSFHFLGLRRENNWARYDDSSRVTVLTLEGGTPC